MRKILTPLFVSLALCGGAALLTLPGQAQPRGRLPNANPPAAADVAARRTQMCEDRYAAAVGRMAAMETRLKLSAAQATAFGRWRTVQLAAAKRGSETCVNRPAAPARGAQNAARPSPVERMARQEEMLRQRLADLQAERPAFEALYNSLSADQRSQLERGGMRGGRGGRGMGDGMMMRRGRGDMDARMDRGMQGGPRGPRPDMPPSPPPGR